MSLKLMAAVCALGSLLVDISALAASGTGFAVANGRIVITNFHVVQGCTSVTVANFGTGVVRAADPRVDIAIVEPERPVNASLHFRSRANPVKLGEEIITIGFPLKGLLSSNPIVTTGIVASLSGIRDDPTRLQITAPIQPGNSGGPVLDRAGNVVGIAVSKLNALKLLPLTGDFPQNVNFAITSSVVTPILDSFSIRYQVGTDDKERSVSDIVSAASSSVVSLECLAREASRAPTAAPVTPGPNWPTPLPWFGEYGAIAWDRGTGKYGASWNQSSPKRAEEAALGECVASGCQIVARIGPRMCGALATTQDGTRAGAAWRRDREAARLAAFENCRKDQAGECVIRTTDCNR